MTRLTRVGIVLGLLVALSVPGLRAAGLFHNHLVKSSPAEDDTLATSPSQIRLWFAEPAIPRLSGVALWTVGADSTRLPVGPMAATDTNVSVATTVTTPLAPGAYRVRWRTASADGHAIRGFYDFVVTP